MVSEGARHGVGVDLSLLTQHENIVMAGNRKEKPRTPR